MLQEQLLNVCADVGLRINISKAKCMTNFVSNEQMFIGNKGFIGGSGDQVQLSWSRNTNIERHPNRAK